jgi:hypothetical protein
MELREGNSFVEIWSNQEVVERLKMFFAVLCELGDLCGRTVFVPVLS